MSSLPGLRAVAQRVDDVRAEQTSDYIYNIYIYYNARTIVEITVLKKKKKTNLRVRLRQSPLARISLWVYNKVPTRRKKSRVNPKTRR